MAQRAIYETGKDWDSDIIQLCNGGEYWSPRMKADAIQDIEPGARSYDVPS